MTQTTQNPIERRLQEMADHYIQQLQLTVRPNGQIISQISKKNVPYDELARDFNLATLDQQGVGISKESKVDMLTRRLDAISTAAVNEIIDSIKYDPSKKEAGHRELLRWMSAFLGYEPSPLEVSIMQHFIWQVGRKARELKVIHHMMPIFIGKQGDGKSFAITRLLEPIRQLTIAGQSVAYLTDPNNYKTIGLNLCVFTDEMARCAVVDIDRLKQIISGEDLNFRVFHTQKNGFSTQRCTLIGASNKEFRDLINDPTGARRFYPFKCIPHADLTQRQERWQTIREIDILSIWQSVDENQDEPYIMPYYGEILQIQERLRIPSSIEEWLVESDIQPGEHKVALSDLYRKYANHVSDSNRKDVFAKRNFKLTLIDMGFKQLAYANGNVFLLCSKQSPNKDGKILK